MVAFGGAESANKSRKVASIGHPAGELVRATPTTKAMLSRQAAAGKIVRLSPGVYLRGATLPVRDAVLHHRYKLVAQVWPGATVCDRSALAGGELVDSWLFVCHPNPTRRADLRLPGLNIAVRIGPGPQPGDMPLPEGLHMSGVARGLVENVDSPGRPVKGKPNRRAGTEAVQTKIDEYARYGGAGRIKNILVQLEAISAKFPPVAVKGVKSWLVAVLGSTDGVKVTSSSLAARLSGTPYDQRRLDIFQDLVAVLERTAPEPRPAIGGNEKWQWEPFFEAYFSNFIEGTEFSVEEARKIAIDGHSPVERPEDAHDVAATFRIIASPSAADVPTNPESLIEMLQDRHSILMAARQEKHPGEFKVLPNFVGGYEFVAPEMVIGTLMRGFEIVSPVTDPFHRAVSLMLLLTEVHPFADGNGRIARIFANAELQQAGQVRIVIPTVYRNNYLAGLSAVSNRAGKGESLISVLRFAQRWTGAIDWSTFETADGQIAQTNAYLDPNIAESSGIRLTLP